MKPFGELTDRETAMRIIMSHVNSIEKIEKVALDEALGRVLAVDVVAGFDVPPFDRASMDGYAVKAHDTAGASKDSPVRLRLIGAQHTGEVYRGQVGARGCLEIATGSPMPRGSDAVVMVEHTKLDMGEVIVYRQVEAGRNMAPAGEDMKKGDKVLEAGVTVTPGMVGALAALGYEGVEVYAKPRVAIYSSGPEIVPQGTPLEPGQIYDVNSFTLGSVIGANGGVPVKRGIMMDDASSIEAAVRDASGYDAGVFSGGSSVGVKDLFGEVMEKLGTVYFHGVRVKPGKPTLFGEVDGTPVFGMPGYPTSCLNNSYVFLVPAIRLMARLQPRERREVTVVMGHRMVSRSDREQFVTVRLDAGKAYRVYKQSGDITSMTHADGYVILPVGVDTVKEGEAVTVTLLD
ncbi:molybdenum cofactor biosynthesis protein [Candidatus Bathyarchaeota archaeon]|nr:molybdenum cofactor biosynthesis protein [Candidatus Bathyarchaeota archaeon]